MRRTSCVVTSVVDDEMLRREPARLLAVLEHVVGQQRADLIAGERVPRRVLGERERRRAADAIAIRIGRQRQIGARPRWPAR